MRASRRPLACGTGSPVAAAGGIKRERGRVDAVALTTWARSVVEDVAKVTAAATAEDLGAAHEKAVVCAQLDRAGDRTLGETGPPGARVELRVGAKQLARACGTAVRATVLVVHVLASERRLGAAATKAVVLLGGQLFPPLLVGLVDVGHGTAVGGG